LCGLERVHQKKSGFDKEGEIVVEGWTGKNIGCGNIGAGPWSGRQRPVFAHDLD